MARIPRNINPLNWVHTIFRCVNREFHFGIYEISKLGFFLKAIENLWTHVGPYLSLYTRSRNVAINMDFHRKMFDAVVQQNEEELIAALEQDIETSANQITSWIESQDGETDSIFAESI